MNNHLMPLAEEAVLSYFDDLCTLLQSNPPKPQLLGIAEPKGPYALYYHQVEIITRARDLALIARRLFRGRAQRQEADALLQARRPHDAPAGAPWPPETVAAARAVDGIVHELRVDFEGLFLFGAVFLDQWSFMVARLAGLPKPTEVSFFPLVEEQLDLPTAPEPIVALRTHKQALRWLVFWFRHFRNDFIVHTKAPTQKGPITGGLDQDIILFMPTAVGWEDEDGLEKATRKLTRFAPEWLRKSPDDYWEKQRWRRLLERIAENIGSLDKKQDRLRVAAVAKRAGMMSPRSQVLVSSLARTITEATSLVIETALQHPSRIDLGSIH
jgi:hypothetical protein